MAAANTGEGWVCKNHGCGAQNTDKDYRCKTCNSSTKPYSFTSAKESIDANEPPRALPESDSGLDESERRITWSQPSVLPATASSSSVYPFTSSVTSTSQAPQGDGQEKVIAFPDQVCRIVLIGKTGNGKSSTGNMILNRTDKRLAFEVGEMTTSCTLKCRWQEGVRFGTKLEVVDTPGVFKTDQDEVIVFKEIRRCIGIVAPGPHALLLIVRSDVRFTQEESNTVELLKELLGHDIMNHMIVVYTHGDRLPKHISQPEALAKVLRSIPEALRKIIQEANDRCIVFNNVEENQERKNEQVQQLLLLIRDMLARTGDLPFSNALLSECEEMMISNARQLADLLNSKVSEQHRDMIRAGMESRDKLQELLNTMLDQQEKGDQDAAEKQRHLEAAQTQVEKFKKDLDRALSSEGMLRQENKALKTETQRLKTEEWYLERDKTRLKQQRDELEKERDHLKNKKSCQIS